MRKKVIAEEVKTAKALAGSQFRTPEKGTVATAALGPRQMRVRKIGNSLGMILPKEVAIELGVEDGSTLFVNRAPEGRMYLTAFDPDFSKAMEIARQGMKRYRETLRELAK